MKNRLKAIFVPIFITFAVILNACTPQVTQKPSAVSPTFVLPSALSAVLSEITGKVEIKQAGQDGFAPANPDSFLNENGQAMTGDDGRVRLDLSTGTIVRVAPASLFTLTSNEPSDGSLKTRVDLALGQLYIILNGGSMEVKTPTGTAAVRGSYMSVDYDPVSGEVRVTCLEGNCSLSNAAGTVDITAGQTAVITGAGQPPQVGEMSDQDIQDWLNINPEAKLVAAALTDVPAATEAPVATDAPPTEVVPTEVVVHPPLVFAPPIKKPVEPNLPQLTSTPTAVPTSPPSLTPTVIIGNFSPSSAVVGEPLSIAVNVLPSSGGPIPTGTVRVYAENIPICTASLTSTGNATCVGGVTVAGLYNLVAYYFGDANYLTAQAILYEYAVNKAGTTTTIKNQIPNSSLVNTAVVFVATVDTVAPGAGSPTGSVTFSDGVDNCTALSAPWTCSIIFANSGSRVVIATYSGDSNFESSNSASVIQDVAGSQFLNAAGPIATTIVNSTDCNKLYSVEVTDADGVSDVKVEFSLNNNFSSSTPVALTTVGGNIWQGSIIIPANAGDVIYWRFVALDSLANRTFFGGAMPYTIGYPGGAASSYSFDLGVSAACVP